MIGARKPRRHTALVSTLLAAGLITGGPRSADAGVPGEEAAFALMREQLERGWDAVAAVVDRPPPVAGEPPAAPVVAPSAVDPNPSAPIEQLEVDGGLAADLRQRAGELERWWQAIAAADQTPPPAGGEAARVPAAAPAAPVQDGAADDATAVAAAGPFGATPEVIERALERALVQTDALLLPAGTIEVESSFAYVRREDDAPMLIVEGDTPATVVLLHSGRDATSALERTDHLQA